VGAGQYVGKEIHPEDVSLFALLTLVVFVARPDADRYFAEGLVDFLGLGQYRLLAALQRCQLLPQYAYGLLDRKSQPAISSFCRKPLSYLPLLSTT
jgi:hypothetical protein